MKKHLLVFAVMFVGAGMCVTAEEAAPPSSVTARPPVRLPFYVYKDGSFSGNHYIPSGFMGDYSDIAVAAASKDTPAEGETCIRVKYSAKVAQGNKWAGVYWQDGNWGTAKNFGYNLTGAKKLKFMARGQKGGEAVEFGCGGIGGNFPDTLPRLSAAQVLTSEWKEYEVDLEGNDLSICQGGFYFTVQQEKHPGGAVFYIDNIRFE
jgi:hypothetical protein